MDGSGEIPRFVRDSDRVKVHDAVDRLAPALAGYVVPNRPEIVPEVLPAGRLDAGEDPHRWTRVPRSLTTTIRVVPLPGSDLLARLGVTARR
jgi:hypothetical protein